MDAPPTSPTFLPRVRPRWLRAVRWLLAGLALAVAGGVGLHAFLNSDAVKQALLRRIRERLPDPAAHVELGEEYAVDWFGRLRVGPVRISAGPRARPWLTIDELLVRPRYSALLRGRAEPARITLRHVRLDAGTRRDELRRLLGWLRRPPSAGKRAASGGEPSTLAVRVEELSLGRSGAQGWRPLAGPVDAELLVSRSAEGRAVTGSLSLPGDGGARLEGRLLRGQPLSLDLWLEGLPVSALPENLLARLPVRLAGGTLEGHLGLEAPERLETGRLEGTLAARAVLLSGERLAPEPVGPLRLGAEARVHWDLSKQRLWIDRARLSAGEDAALHVDFEGDVALAGEHAFRLEARADALAYPKVLAALPPQLAPGPEAPHVEGRLSASAQLAGVPDRPADWTLEVKLDLAALRKAARAAPPSSLAMPFTYRPEVPTGYPQRAIRVGEGNPDFVPFSALPAYVYRAVTLSEDAGFFAHQGFDFAEMKDSFIEVAEARRLRGASTLTQQLAKNLFLTRERTWARKVREALVTVALEASLSKQRLMEIYLNIIEWGPDVYGLGEAARHYFGVPPRELSIKQAAFLATLIPCPLRCHVLFEKGALTEAWEKRVHDLLARLRDEGVITPEEFETADAAPLSFRGQQEGGTPLGASSTRGAPR